MSVTVRQASLAQLETIIERGVQTFVEVGLALMEVRDRRLYREAGYPTFEKYCRERWRFQSNYARRLIDSAATVKILADPELDDKSVPMGTLPTTERHVRELAPLAREAPETARAVWREVNEEAKREKRPVTAAKVRAAVQRVRREPDPDYVDADYIEVEPDPRIPDLKAAIRLLEPLYQAYDDQYAPRIRAHTAALRNVLRQMEDESGRGN